MPTVSTHHFLSAMCGAQRRGWSREQLLEEAGFRKKIDISPEVRFSTHQMTRLTKAIWRVLDDEFMGFTRHPSKTGTFAFAVQAMAKEHNLESALLTGFRFYSLVTDDIVTQLLQQGDVAIIDIEFTEPELDAEHYFEHFWMVIWHRLLSWLSGIRIPLRHARFTEDEPAYKQELGYMFPGNQSFGASTSRLEFDTRYLALPIIRSKKEVDLFLARSPYNLLSIPGSDGTLHGTVVSMLTPGVGEALHFPRIEELAEQLGVSNETLRRRLRAESSSYTQIKSDLRKSLAYRLLATEDIAINQIALQIGFTESSSFVRAFKDWSGITPMEYRRRLLSRKP